MLPGGGFPGFFKMLEMVFDTRLGAGTVRGLGTKEDDSALNLAPEPVVGDG